MKRAILFLSSIVIFIFITTGCSNPDGNVDSTEPQTTETSFNFTLASFKKQETASAAFGRLASFTVDQVMTGQLTATNTTTSAIQTFDWSIYFDETSWEVQSNKTIILAPGTYEFALLLTKGDQQYAGSAVQAITDGTIDVPMIIRPIIGNTITDVTLVASLSEFKFQYDPVELSAASLVNPQMGMIIGAGTEVIYGINPATGISDIWINLTEGPNTIQLKLYEGSLQVGRSITAQESVLVSAGLNITMDLVALHGETTFALTEAGGDATFSFNIPAAVVDEAGGLANLEAVFSLSGANNPIEENNLTLIQDVSGDYTSHITLTNKQYDDVTLSLTFNDLSQAPKEFLGSCVQIAPLDKTQRTISCDMTLRRRAVIGGNLLATVGINAFNEAHEPLAGARVFAKWDDIVRPLGTTGIGAFGTEGYFKAFTKAGLVDCTVFTTKKYKHFQASLSPLGIYNQDLVLDLPFIPFIEVTGGKLNMSREDSYVPNGNTYLRSVLNTDYPSNISKFSTDVTVNNFVAAGSRAYARFKLIYKPEGFNSVINSTEVAVELRGEGPDLRIISWAVECYNTYCTSQSVVTPSGGTFPNGSTTAAGVTHNVSIEYLTGTNTFQVGVDGQYSILDVSGFLYFDAANLNNGEIYLSVDQVDEAGDNGIIDATFDNVYIDNVLYDDFSDVNDSLTKWQNWAYFF